MAKFHVHVAVIGKGQSTGGARGFSHYIAREQQEHATQFQRYMDRENGQPKEDLVAHGHAHMPAWARENPHAFWLAADRYERANGVLAKVVDVALPRELSVTAQRELADDIREVYFSEHAHSWAIHSPQAKDGSGDQPHMHLMFSPRTNDGRDRSPKQYFARYNPTHPDQGGAQKERAWDAKGRLRDLRWGVATLTNASLERAGIPTAVSHLSLEAQGVSRDPARYSRPHDRTEVAQVRTYRGHISEGEKSFELELARAAWSQQKQQAGIADLSREAMVDHVRDHTFRYDRSPRREQQRSASFDRSLARTRTPTPNKDNNVMSVREQIRSPERPLSQALEQLKRGLGRGKEESGGGVGLRVRLREEEQEHGHEKDRGMSW